MGIEIVTPTYSLLERAINMARDLDITCYDATYLALAEALEFEFITADEKFYNKIPEEIRKTEAVQLLVHLHPLSVASNEKGEYPVLVTIPGLNL